MNKLGILLIAFGLFNSALAQKQMVNSAIYNLENGNPDELVQAKADIDKASADERTKNWSLMYYTKARVYCRIYEKKGNEIIKPSYNGLCGLVAGKSFQEFYKSTDKDKKGIMEEAAIELPNVFVALFYESQTRATQFQSAKDPQSKFIADTLMDYFSTMLDLYGKLDTATINNFERSKVKRNYFSDMLAYYSLKNSDEAKRLVVLTALTENEKPSAGIVKSLSDYYIGINQNEKAKEVIKTALAKSNNDNEMFQLLVDYYVKTKQQDQLFAEVDAQLKQNPSSRNYFVRAALLDEKGDIQSAIKDYEQSVALDEFNYDAHWNLGVDLYKNAKVLIEEKNKATDKVAAENKINQNYAEAKKHLEFAQENDKYDVDDATKIAKALRNVCLAMKDNACAAAQRDKIRTLGGHTIAIGDKFTYSIKVENVNNYDLTYLNKFNTYSTALAQKGNQYKEFDIIDKTDLLYVSVTINGTITDKSKVTLAIIVNGEIVAEAESLPGKNTVSIQF